MRDNTNYMETGVLSALELTSNFPQTVLQNFYEKSLHSIESGGKDAPYALRAAGQPARHDPRRLHREHASHSRHRSWPRYCRSEAQRRQHIPAGSLIVKCNQPYGRLAKILLEKQDFPDNNLRTYDDTGWTMGLMSQAQVRRDRR